MIVNSSEYKNYLYAIQDANIRKLVPLDLPKDEPKLEIDLNKRTITAPKFLSVQKDHNSETVYFLVDRYFDNIDLANTTGIVQYKNANPVDSRKGFIYAFPEYYEVTEEIDGVENKKLLLPWTIEGPATAYSGEISFAVQFYVLDGYFNEENPEESNLEFVYQLNTLEVKSRILEGMDVLETSENYSYPADTVLDIYQKIRELKLSNDIYWLTME